MADANDTTEVVKDERTLVMKQESGEDVTYQVSEFTPEGKLLYAKIEMLHKDSENIRGNAEFSLEKNQILQAHYLQTLKPLIEPSDEAEIVEEADDEQGADEETSES